MDDTPTLYAYRLGPTNVCKLHIPLILERIRTMDTNEDSNATGKTPEQIEAEQHAVEGFMDGLVDAFEDALADVDYSLNKKYDRPQLIEAMKLAIQIDDLIEYLKQYLPDGKAPDEG